MSRAKLKPVRRRTARSPDLTNHVIATRLDPIRVELFTVMGLICVARYSAALHLHDDSIPGDSICRALDRAWSIVSDQAGLIETATHYPLTESDLERVQP